MKGRAPERSLVKKAGSEEPVYSWVKDRVLISRSQISSVQGSTHPLPPRSLMNREGGRRALTPDHSPDRHPGAQLPVSPPPSRRSPSYIVCNTTSSDEVLEMKVTVQVDRAKIHQDLFFQYVEDPTIVRIEPEWSIVR